MCVSRFAHSVCGFCCKMNTLYKSLSRYRLGDIEENHDQYEDIVVDPM